MGGSPEQYERAGRLRRSTHDEADGIADSGVLKPGHRAIWLNSV
jgi:hypothetical protein